VPGTSFSSCTAMSDVISVGRSSSVLCDKGFSVGEDGSAMLDMRCGMSLRGNTHRCETVSLRNRRLLDLTVMKGGRWLWCRRAPPLLC
jgi:hypothetical protein